MPRHDLARAGWNITETHALTAGSPGHEASGGHVQARDRLFGGIVQDFDFARRFGEVVEYPFLKGLDGFPEITPVIKLEHEKVNFGGLWHSDTAYLDHPPMTALRVVTPVALRDHDRSAIAV